MANVPVPEQSPPLPVPACGETRMPPIDLSSWSAGPWNVLLAYSPEVEPVPCQ
jgi:hypothetical protein